jgi:hypothetical protein
LKVLKLGKLANIPKFDKQFWREVGNEITDEIRVQTQKKGKDVFNRDFNDYSEGYADRKPRIRRGSGGSKVNLTLTGDMMNGLQVRGFTPDSVTIGWSGTNAKKIQWNEDMGRAVTTAKKPLSNDSIKIVQQEARQRIKRNADKETAKPINFKIGR